MDRFSIPGEAEVTRLVHYRRIPTAIRSSRGRWIVGLFGLCAAVAAIRAASIDGFWTPIFVAGPSMAPTLWGPSLQTQCSGCGITVRMHEHPTNPLGEGVRCQNCGDFVELSQVERHPPDRVLIDRAAYWWRTPRHGDLVAIKNGRGRLQAKRIIGVPGDQIGLHQSSVRINGRRVDAVLPPEQIPSILVFDTAHLDRIGPRWQVADTGQWMVYHHRSIHDKNQPAPIRDDYPANTAVSRQLMPVVHKQLTGRLTAAEPVRIEVDIWLHDHWERFRARFPVGDFEWSVSSLAAEGVSGMTRPLERWQRIDFHSSTETAESLVSAEAPLAVRVLNGQNEEQAADAQLGELLVSRHFRWYVRRGDQQAWPAAPFRLQPRRYFVIGDNLPVSVDSRAEPQGIECSQIIGRVIRLDREKRSK